MALDTNFSSEPIITVNHNNNSKEIFVQDDANKIYLISNTGSILWKKQLSEKIIGEVVQIDAYKNHKLQLLFCTESKLHLIDRNGSDVGNFPVKLPAKTSNGVNVMDYSNDKNYRLLVGCVDNMVYNYNVDGDQVKGWEYSPGASPAQGKIWHYVNNGKDYIIVYAANGSVKVVQRSGKDRLSLDKTLPSFNSQQVYFKSGTGLDKTFICTSDTIGNFHKLYLNGMVESIAINDLKSFKRLSYFDANNDNSLDYILTSNQELKVLDVDQKELFKYQFEGQINTEPILIKIKGEANKIGVLSEGKIYLFNDAGAIVDGFPLSGNTRFQIQDLNNDEIPNLVVGQGNILYTYNLEF